MDHKEKGDAATADLQGTTACLPRIFRTFAVCLLPSRPDLDENMQYIAGDIEQMGGTYHLFAASASPEGACPLRPHRRGRSCRSRPPRQPVPHRPQWCE